MEVLYFPFNDLARFIRHTIRQSDQQTDSLLPPWLFLLYIFIVVSVLLLLLIEYFRWKLQEAEDDLSRYLQGRNAIYRRVRPNTLIRRNVGAHWHT